MSIIDTAIIPQARTLDSVHKEYGQLTVEEVKSRARNQLDKYLATGRSRAHRVVDSIFNETPVDLYAPAERIKVDLDEGKRLFRALIADRPALGLHQHGLDQLAGRIGFNTRFLHDLQEKGEQWSQELGAQIFNELLQHRPAKEKYLVRTVNGQGRAFLSDAYKCIDSRPMVDEMIGMARKEGALIVDGIYSETRVQLKVIIDELVEIFPGEWAVLGFGYSNSDFGDGAVQFEGFIERLLCLNGAMVSTKFRQIHLGKRAGNDALLSERTLKLMSAGDKSAARDTVRGLLSKESRDKLVDQVRAAYARELNPAQMEAFLKKQVTQADAKAIVEKFTSADVVEVPAGQNAWRFSNAISWLARETEDGRKKMDLERLAGEAMDLGKAA